VTPDDLGNFLIGFIGMEQDVSMSDCGGIGFPMAGEAFKERSLIVGKVNGVLALSHDHYIVAISI